MPQIDAESLSDDLEMKLQLLVKSSLPVTGSFAFYIQMGMSVERAAKKAEDIDVLVPLPDMDNLSQPEILSKDIRTNFDIVYEKMMPEGWQNRVVHQPTFQGEIILVNIEDIVLSGLNLLETTFRNEGNYPLFNVQWIQKHLRLATRIVGFLEAGKLSLEKKQMMSFRLKRIMSSLRKENSFSPEITAEMLQAIKNIIENIDTRIDSVIKRLSEG